MFPADVSQAIRGDLRFTRSEEARRYLGDPARPDGWTGVETVSGAGADGGDAARLSVPGTATFRYETDDGDGSGWDASHGRFEFFDPAGDWWDWPILAFDVKLASGLRAVDLTLSLLTPDDVDDSIRQGVDVRVSGDGWQRVSVPVADFRLNDAVTPTYLSYVQGLEFEVLPVDGDGRLLFDDVRLQRGQTVGLDASVQSKPGEPGETIEYDVTVSNCSENQQAVSLRLERDGGEVIPTRVEPDHLQLGPGEIQTVTVRADVPTYDDPGFQGELPEGGRERWRLKAVPDGRGDVAETVELVHVARMEPPYILHSEAEWDEIRELVETEDWAREQADEHISFARDYEPPEPQGADEETVYESNQPAKDVWRAAFAWQLTREREFAETVADFVRDVTDPENGYLATPNACGPGKVHEGAFFRYLARSYDTVRDADVFTAEEERRLEDAFRVYMEWARQHVDEVGNQALSAVSGALQCALAIQDWERVERFLEGPCGIEWQIRRGIMDDGWFAEVSTGYNLGNASHLSRVGLALRRWGVEILENRYPAVYHESTDTNSRPGEDAGPWMGYSAESGMYAAAWGPSHRNYRSVRDIFDAAVPLINEDKGVLGINDAHGEQYNADDFDVGAYAYGDEEYRRVATGRDLLYPVDRSDVKDPGEDNLLPNTVADNAGLGMLRSQGVDSVREQYQAALKYGSHGKHHGHWDRLNLVYLRRFGKMATHTPPGSFGYGNFMYQMYRQTSMAHSMVVVDGKNQYPAPSDRLLWYEGEQFQAIAVENESEWSRPRFRSDFASEEELEAGVMEHSTGIEVEIPDDAPEPGDMSDFTEPIRSRRAMAVTDDYVLVFDHVAGDEEHRFDVLYQLLGFEEFADRNEIEFVEERETFDDGPYLAGQFVTDARIYDVEGSVRATFVTGYEPGEPQPQPTVEEGMESMNIDVHTAWPPEREHVVSTNPFDWNTYSAGRTRGREASFVTLLELQEDKEDRQVETVTADGPEQVQVEFIDGTTHHWKVDGLHTDEDRPAVTLHLTAENTDGSTSKESTE